ncbi:zinc ribbon domain-containing protein [Halapricum salinum]|uniref:Zinc ribbon domain-containing protein n=1 Tax=Halapricum salinum TaxID=1457250 RepID=A0A4D6HH38_9EURY|nr:zinc ribbon domain-containing protein [Halapricum salinum]
MGRQHSNRRPVIAVLLAAVLTGLGHLYLGRHKRAFGWVALSLSVVALSIPDPPPASVVALLPALFVFTLSVLDAFWIAVRDRGNNGLQRDSWSSHSPGECPVCGEDLDPELDFCPWCTSRLDRQTETAEE